jgi:outer membrane protein assembly factor BamB
MRTRAATALLAVLLLLVTAACAGAPHRREDSPAGSTALAGWFTYHRTQDRAGHVSHTLPGPLHRRWSKGLGGAVYGEPLVVGSTLVVATESNDVFGLDARSGGQRWRARLGTPQRLGGLQCGNIDPLGVTSTPAYDPATGSVFVVAETSGGAHTLWALSAATGAKRWHRQLDTQTSRNRSAQQQRSALLVTAGRVITTFGGLAGDCGDYVGYATSVPTDGKGPTASYAVPTAREGGMWAPPGAVRGTNGHVYVASGNGAELGGAWDGSDSVIELDPVTLRPLSVFAPSTWADDNVHDLDLGSSAPASVPAVGLLVIAGKRGTVYLLRPSSRGVGSQVAQLSGCRAFGGSAVVGTTVLMGCVSFGSGSDGIRALRVGASSLHWSWTLRGVFGSPVVAGSKVYVADRDSDQLYVLRLSTGEVLSRQHVGDLPHFPSQVVSGNWVFVPSTSGVTAFQGS